MFEENQKLLHKLVKRGNITIATNMAGRGTDIILGGNINFKIQKKLYDILTLSKNYILSKKRIFYSLL
jgi:preprotein translocase subunit SecA